MTDPLDMPADDLFSRVRRRAHNRCESCEFENWQVVGRDGDGNFHPALPIGEASARPVFPTPGDRGWCGRGGPQRFLRITRVICQVVPVTIDNATTDADFRFWCQVCLRDYLRAATAAAVAA